MAKHWPDEQESHTRRSCWMRRHRTLKPETCPEGVSVYAAGISVKVGAHYPGRSLNMPLATGSVGNRDVFSEVSRGHRSCHDNEGPNLKLTMKAEIMNRSWKQKRVTTCTRLMCGIAGQSLARTCMSASKTDIDGKLPLGGKVFFLARKSTRGTAVIREPYVWWCGSRGRETSLRYPMLHV